MRLRALVLDFDGVILESNDLKTGAFEHVFGRFPDHAAAMMAYHHAHVSDSRFSKFRHLVVERLGRPADDPLIGELASAFSAEMLRRMETCAAVPGAQVFLAAVRRRLPVFLASVTPQHELETILERRGLSSAFTRVYGCPPWTKARALADIVTSIGGPEHTLLVGDSAGDQRTAREAAVEFIARDSGLSFDDPQPPTFPDMTSLLAAISARLPEPR
jgi:phosphoglycolate phosphatase-like HAD superfamily hydrolase